jgi:glycine dehydrogenase subunit 2
MEQAAAEARENPDLLHRAPLTTPVGRLDEGRAARELKLRWSTEPAPEAEPARESAIRG